jgi:hypothetical protein
VPTSESNASSGRSGRPKHAKGIVSLILTILLCLPSLVGAAALFINALRYQNLDQWGQTSASLVALGVFIGAPSCALAAVVGGVTALRRGVSVETKFAQLFVVGAAAVAALSLSFRFGM